MNDNRPAAPVPLSPEEYLDRIAKPILTQAIAIAKPDDGIPGRVAADSQMLVRPGLRVTPKARGADEPAFRPLLAESLFRDACVLVDRALRSRAEVEDYATKFFEASVQIQELLTLNEISLREEEQYDVPQSADKFLQDAELTASGGFKTAQNKIDTTSGDNNYWTKTDSRVVPGAQQLLQAQVSQMDAQAASASGRWQSIQAMRGYKALMQSYQKERNSAARLTGTRRALALTSPDGVLNYDRRRGVAQDRFDEEFNAVLVRLVTAARGFETLYGYSRPLPVNADGSTHDFDAVYLWCQKTTTWLAALLDNQQVATSSFSLAKLVGGSHAFNAARASGKWQGFAMPDDAFGERKCVRLRSIAAQVVCNKPYGSWSMAITPPSSGSYRTLSGALISGGAFSNGQMPTVMLGRVVADRFSMSGEAVAGPVIQNATPLGTWSIEMDSESSALVPLSDVLDVTLHFTVAYF